MKEYRALRWIEETHTQETPLLFVGERVRTVKLESGMTIYRIDHGDKYRLDALSFANERDEKNGVHQLTLTPIDDKGKEGIQKFASSTNSWMAVWLADITKEHQELFYPEQQVNGTIVNGVFAPDEKYLVDWYGMFMKYFDILAAHPYRGQTQIDREMPRLVRRCIDEFGVGVFNAMVREYFVGKELNNDMLYEAWYNIFDSDWLYNIDRKLSFPSIVLKSTINMSTCFEDALKTVVFKQGVKLDIAKMLP